MTAAELSPLAERALSALPVGRSLYVEAAATLAGLSGQAFKTALGELEAQGLVATHLLATQRLAVALTQAGQQRRKELE
jgi:hypothetical protein